MKMKDLVNWWKDMPLDVFFKKAFWCIIGLCTGGFFLGLMTLNLSLCILFGGMLLTSIFLYMEIE